MRRRAATAAARPRAAALAWAAVFFAICWAAAGAPLLRGGGGGARGAPSPPTARQLLRWELPDTRKDRLPFAELAGNTSVPPASSMRVEFVSWSPRCESGLNRPTSHVEGIATPFPPRARLPHTAAHIVTHRSPPPARA